jgi:hypothetical protein
MADLMLATSRNKTLIDFGHAHRCLKHECTLSNAHLMECDNFTGMESVGRFAEMIKCKNIRTWNTSDILEASRTYSSLAVQLRNQQEQKGITTVALEHQLAPTVKRGRGRPKKNPANQGIQDIRSYLGGP